MNDLAIQVSNLRKEFRIFSRREGLLGGVKDLFQRDYRTLVAVNDISFNVKRGEIVGFIGPNGAGKSTTIKMLTGILKPTAGDMNVLGHHPFKQRKAYSAKIGVVFGQRTQLWWDIAVIESLNLLGHIYAVPQDVYRQRLDQLVQILDLKEVLHQPVRKLSLGQRLRSDMAASLIHGPELLFLDEPTIGVDAVAKRAIRQFLKDINQQFNTTVILTTHDLVEIEELCERITIIDKGAIVYDGSLEHIKSLPGLERVIVVDFAQDVSEAQLAQALPKAGSIQLESRSATISYDATKVATVELIDAIVRNFSLADLSIGEPSIEDVLVRIYRDGLPRAGSLFGTNGAAEGAAAL